MDSCVECGETSGCCRCQVLEAMALICADAEPDCWAGCDGVGCAAIFADPVAS